MLRRKVIESNLYEYKNQKGMHIEYDYDCKFCDMYYTNIVTYYLANQRFYSEIIDVYYHKKLMLKLSTFNKFLSYKDCLYQKDIETTFLPISYKRIKPLVKEFVYKEKLKIFL